MTAADRLVSLGLVEAGYTFLNLDGRWPAGSSQALGSTCCRTLLSNNSLDNEPCSMHQSAVETAVCSTCIPFQLSSKNGGTRGVQMMFWTMLALPQPGKHGHHALQMVTYSFKAFITLLAATCAEPSFICAADCWHTRSRAPDNSLQADPVKFPSGIKAVADAVHAKGLTFGIYSDAGFLTCAGYPGSRSGASLGPWLSVHVHVRHHMHACRCGFGVLSRHWLSQAA